MKNYNFVLESSMIIIIMIMTIVMTNYGNDANDDCGDDDIAENEIIATALYSNSLDRNRFECFRFRCTTSISYDRREKA